MAEKNSIIKEALLDIQNIQNALSANTKEILRGVAREEIDGVVKESLMKEMFEEEEIDAPDAIGGGEELNLEPAVDGIGGEDDSVAGGLGDIDTPMDGAPMGADLGMDSVELGGDDLDMTAASDDEVIAIYKKLSGEDEIEIVGDEIHLNISEPGEYVVKLDDSTAPAGVAGLDAPEIGGDDLAADAEGDEAEFEIEMGDEDDSEEPTEDGGEEESDDAPDDLVSVGGDEEGDDSEEEEEEETEEITEQIPVGSAQAHRLQARQTAGVPLGAGADNLKESETAKLVSEANNKYNALLTEANELKAENLEFRTALKQFRTKLVETVLHNANLTYITNLFLEHSTTKAEKDAILKRFDEVSTLAESKKLNRIIEGELSSRQPITESVENKLIKGGTTSISKQLNESTAYVDPSTKRIMDLINRVEKR